MRAGSKKLWRAACLSKACTHASSKCVLIIDPWPDSQPSLGGRFFGRAAARQRLVAICMTRA